MDVACHFLYLKGEVRVEDTQPRAHCCSRYTPYSSHIPLVMVVVVVVVVPVLVSWGCEHPGSNYPFSRHLASGPSHSLAWVLRCGSLSFILVVELCRVPVW